MRSLSDSSDKKLMSKEVAGWALCVPAILIFGVFFVGPALVGLYISLFEWNGSSPTMHFVGLGNYTTILEDVEFWNAIKVTALTLVFMLGIKLPLALLMAIGLSSPGPLKRLYRTAVFLPYVLSTTVVTIIWVFLYDPYQGLINFLLRSIGLAFWQQGWLGLGSTALPSVVVAGAWWTFGLYVVLFTAGLASIPRDFYDAAKLETSSRLRVLFTITIPLLREQIFVATVMTIGGVLGYLTGFFMLLTGGGPSGHTETLGILSYHAAFRGLEFGRASAISILILLFMFILIIGPTIRVVRSRVEY